MADFGTWFVDTFVDETQPKPSTDKILERILNPYEDIDYRVPFLFTSDLRNRDNVPPVRMKNRSWKWHWKPCGRDYAERKPLPMKSSGSPA